MRKQFEDAKRNYTIAFLDGAEIINNSYAPHAGKALKNGDGSIMSTYRKNKATINELRLEIDAELSKENHYIEII